MTRLWLDDIRLPPEGWVWAKTSDEAIAALSNADEAGVTISEMSFDHDLGGDDTARRVVLWLCEMDVDWPERIYCHSANPVGYGWITGMVERYAPPGTLRR